MNKIKNRFSLMQRLSRFRKLLHSQWVVRGRDVALFACGFLIGLLIYLTLLVAVWRWS